MCDLTFEPEARAQCGSSARWDPCGGRPEPDGVKGRPYRDLSGRQGSTLPNDLQVGGNYTYMDLPGRGS